jgi:sugar phosphate permease
MQFLHAHPLVIDYIKSESRGKATAAQNIGNLIGEAFAMIVLIQIQISLSIKASVWIVGTIVASLSFGVLFLVSEPRLRKLNLNLPEKSERSQEEIPLL